MKSENSSGSQTVSFSFYVGFGLKLLALGLLLSLVPLLFVNLPLRMLFIGFATPIYSVIMFALNVVAVLVCLGFAAKLLFSWGVSGHKFLILPANLEP